MALSGLRCRGLVWRLRPGPGPGLSGPRGLPRAPLCCFSSRGGPGALAAAVTAAAKRVTGAYERFLRRRFPRVNPSARPGGERNPQNPAENVAAAPERPAAAVPGHGAAAAVPPGPAEGAAGAGSGHPALRQLPRHRPHVLLPPAAPHPALLDAAAAPAVPGARGLGAPRRLRGRARQPGAGGAGAARPAAAGTAAGALPAGAGGGAAARVPAPHPARRLLGAAAGAGDAAGAARPGAEPGAVPDAVAAAAAAAAPPAQPRPGAAGAGPGAAAARPGAAGRRRAARGLLPAWAQPRAPGAARVPRVAGALAAPVGAARSLGSVSAGAQHGAAGAQPRPRLTPPFCPETPPVWGRGTAGERPTGLPGFLPDYSSRFRLFGRPGDPEMRHLPPGGHAASRPRPVGSA
ncbi:LETM1 domain-containing protein 1 isoform X1 [Caloenas nicobarica]|uniref:LETM1 domain-containing protein 1 isoform X1 n=1 Tax=Caloenas nicobarica TaxID=187106 RepID=UPI0032B7819D